MESTRFTRGMDVFRKVDKDLAESIMNLFKNTSPDLAQYAIEYGYGDVMSRDGLDLTTRELLNVAMLGAMGTAPLQLEGHIKGALNVGVSKEMHVETIIQISVYAGFPAAFNALVSLEKVLSERAE